MKPSLAHRSPTLLACAAAIAVSLLVFLLSGAALQGGAIPLLPALGDAAGTVAVSPATPAKVRRPSAPGTTAVSTAQRVLAPPVPAIAPPPPPAATTVHRVHHARARVVRHAPPSPVQAAASAPAPTAPVAAPQFTSVPKVKAKAHGHGNAAKPAAAPRHGNGHARGHSPEHHQKTPPGQAKHAPAAPPNALAAPPKAKGGGPPAEHGGGNGHNGGNGHKGDKK